MAFGLGRLFDPGESYMGHEIPGDVREQLRKQSWMQIAAAMFGSPDFGSALGAGLSGVNQVQGQGLDSFSRQAAQEQRYNQAQKAEAAKLEAAKLEEEAKKQEINKFRKQLAMQAEGMGNQRLRDLALFAPANYLDNVATEISKSMQPSEPETRSGSSPILEKDPETGEWVTVYTPPEKERNPSYFSHGNTRYEQRPDGTIRPVFNFPEEENPEGTETAGRLTPNQFMGLVSKNRTRKDEYGDTIGVPDKEAVARTFEQFKEMPELLPESVRPAFDAFIAQPTFADPDMEANTAIAEVANQMIPEQFKGDKRRALLAHMQKVLKTMPPEQAQQELQELVENGFTIDSSGRIVKKKKGWF